jgi:hypothetical protein
VKPALELHSPLRCTRLARKAAGWEPSVQLSSALSGLTESRSLENQLIALARPDAAHLSVTEALAELRIGAHGDRIERSPATSYD